jgi:hypothetical protein
MAARLRLGSDARLKSCGENIKIEFPYSSEGECAYVMAHLKMLGADSDVHDVRSEALWEFFASPYIKGAFKDLVHAMATEHNHGTEPYEELLNSLTPYEREELLKALNSLLKLSLTEKSFASSAKDLRQTIASAYDHQKFIDALAINVGRPFPRFWVRTVTIGKNSFFRCMKQRLSFIHRLSPYGGDPFLSSGGGNRMIITLRKPGHDYDLSGRLLRQIFGKKFSSTTEFHRDYGEYYFSSIIIDMNRAEFISNLTDYFMKCH